MEHTEDLPIEAVFNLIKNGVMSLDDFTDWHMHEIGVSYFEGYSYYSNQFRLKENVI